MQKPPNANRGFSSNAASVILPPVPLFRPDTVMSLNDTVAIWDWTYTRRPHTFTLIGSNGRQYLLQAENDKDMNEWIASINWAATFKSTGIKMRSTPCATTADSRSHSGSGSSNQSSSRTTPKTSTFVPSSSTSTEWTPRFMRHPPAADSLIRGANGPVDRTIKAYEVLASSSDMRQTDSISVPREEDYVFKSSSASTPPAQLPYRSLENKPRRGYQRHKHQQSVSRADIVRSKLAELDVQIASESASLEADLRIARNLAILTPYSNSTRQRIEQAIAPVVKRVRQSRQLLCKKVLWREVLSRDLLAEDRDTTLHIRLPSSRPRTEYSDIASMPKSLDGDHASHRRSGRRVVEGSTSDTEEQQQHHVAHRSVYEVSRSDDELRILRSPGGGPASIVPARMHRSNTGDGLVMSVASSSEVEEGDLEEPVPIVAMPRPPERSSRSSKAFGDGSHGGGLSGGFP
jgi:Pleckstrin homology domain